MRLTTTLLILSLLASGVEAATDFGGFAQGGDLSAHETHGDFHDDDSGAPDREGKDSRHFCHCSAHGPALTMSLSLPVIASAETAGSSIEAFLHSQALPPPHRPPKR